MFPCCIVWLLHHVFHKFLAWRLGSCIYHLYFCPMLDAYSSFDDIIFSMWHSFFFAPCLMPLLPWCSSLFSTGGDHSLSTKKLTDYLGQWLLLLLTIYNTWRGRETGPESTSKKGTACRAAKKADDNFKDSHYEHILNLNSRENLCGSRNLVYFRAQILTSRRHSLASLAGWCIAALVWQLLLHLAPQ